MDLALELLDRVLHEHPGDEAVRNACDVTASDALQLSIFPFEASFSGKFSWLLAASFWERRAQPCRLIFVSLQADHYRRLPRGYKSHGEWRSVGRGNLASPENEARPISVSDNQRLQRGDPSMRSSAAICRGLDVVGRYDHGDDPVQG